MTNGSRCTCSDTLLLNCIRPYARTPFYFRNSICPFYLAPLRARILRRLAISRSTHSGKHSSSLLRLSPYMISPDDDVCRPPIVVQRYNVTEATDEFAWTGAWVYRLGIDLRTYAENTMSMHGRFAFFFDKIDRVRVARIIFRDFA